MTRRFTRQPLAQLLLAFIFAFPSLSAAAAEPDPSSPVSERTEASLRPAVVTSNANLRASPWLKGKILAVAKEGMVVQVLEETDRWYRVRTQKGTEAWIHKTLVVLLNRPLRLQPEPAPVPLPGPSAEVQPLPAAEQPASPAFLPDNRTFANFQDLSVYLAAVLLVGLLAVMGLQLRTSRQLKRAMRQVDQITRHPVPERQQTVDVPGFPPPLNAVAEIHPAHPDADVVRLPDLPVELSLLERAVLEAIHEHGEVQEGELREMLENRGFPGVLIKAVISDIVRKTGTEGPPWISVKYAQGRYTYGLQIHNAPGHNGEHGRG